MVTLLEIDGIYSLNFNVFSVQHLNHNPSAQPCLHAQSGNKRAGTQQVVILLSKCHRVIHPHFVKSRNFSEKIDLKMLKMPKTKCHGDI